MLHIVVLDENNPVTFLYMPTITVAQEIPIEENEFIGRIIPAQVGSIAIVGTERESTERITSTLADSIEWL